MVKYLTLMLLLTSVWWMVKCGQNININKHWYENVYFGFAIMICLLVIFKKIIDYYG